MTEIPHLHKWERIMLAMIEAEKDRRGTTKIKPRRRVRNEAEVEVV